jgi:hypothetical protein
MVHLMFEGLTGQEPLSLPVVEQAAGDHAALLAAYEHQQQTFDRYAKNFSANGADLRVVLKDLVRSPWFRAANAAAPLDEGRASQLASFGTGRLLTPEALNRKIFAVLGQPWRPRANEGDYLLREDYYRILYGGIDSDDVVGRITEPNGIMSAIQTRMANELACLIVPQDFARPKAQRRLFGEVEPSYLLQDSNGFEVPQAIEATRRNIQHLHWLLLGEELADDDPELDRTYALYEETWREGMELRASGQISQDLHWACQAREDFWTGADYPEAQAVRRDPNYTIRAWMAVVTYLLLDHKFLYE